MTPDEPKKVYCWDFQDERRCCSSCHSDWEDGYGGPNEFEQSDGIVTHGCCGFSDWYTITKNPA